MGRLRGRAGRCVVPGGGADGGSDGVTARGRAGRAAPECRARRQRCSGRLFQARVAEAHYYRPNNM
ncbi:hypothetical protein DMH08_12945 [Actinomadura sp. WAC 06369]|nr:hypothetical protein DMH08_12945 [Actinomadura sp. WAC 06369]